MPPRDPNLRLQDIAEAIDRIFDYTASHSLESFAVDRMAVDAVVRNFEVIGEAARHIDADTAARLSDVPWQDMRDLRNLLVHEYFGVSVAIIWETISPRRRSSSAACDLSVTYRSEKWSGRLDSNPPSLTLRRAAQRPHAAQSRNVAAGAHQGVRRANTFLTYARVSPYRAVLPLA